MLKWFSLLLEVTCVIFARATNTDVWQAIVARPCYMKQFFLQLATQRTLRCKLQEKITCNTPFCNCNCCVASCKKSRTTLYFSQRCETSCIRVTSPQQLSTQLFFRMGQSELIIRSREISAILFVIERVASCEKSCKRVTPPLQLEFFFIRHRCVASCKKNCFV